MAGDGTAPVARSARRGRLHRSACIVLCLLALLPAASAMAQDWRYRVRPGDTVWDLAAKYVRGDIAWQRLQAYNGVRDPQRLAPGSELRVPVAWLRRQPAKAQVVAVHGAAMVELRRGASSEPVRAGMRLGMGATLRTPDGASLTLQFADGSRLLLQAGSELTLDRLSAYGATGMTDTRMRLPKGRSSSEVKPLRGPASHFSIETPGTMSSVRGTRFRVASDGLRSQAEVTEGHVAVGGGGGQVLLQPGEGTATAAGDRPAAPVPLLPAPRALALDATQRPMRLRWAPVPGAVAYRVQLGASPEFLALLHDAVVPGAEAPLPAVEDGLYGVRVRAIDGNRIEGRDATIEARVALPPPFAIAPAAGSREDAARPRFRWASMGESVRYRLQLAAAAGFERPLLDLPELRATALRAPQALPPGEYAWRIAAIDEAGRSSAFNDPVRFTVVEPGAGPEASAEARDDGLQVRWPAGAQGQRFRFQLSRRADFSRLEVDRELETNEITLEGLRAGTWHARVQTIEPDGYAGPFGPTQVFKTGCLPCRWAAGGALLLLLL